MTTSQPDTEKKMSEDLFFARSMASLLSALDAPTKVYPTLTNTWLGTRHEHKSEKACEIDRQIERIRPYLAWLAEEENTGVDAEGLNRSIAFLRGFASSPAPIPMLAIGNDGIPSAFLQTGEVSLEATFENDRIHYLFSDKALGTDGYFEDNIGEQAIPTNLMVLIYQHFARNEKKEGASR